MEVHAGPEECSGLREVQFSKAKAGLSQLVDAVVGHQPARVVRHRGRRQRLVLVSDEDLAATLESFVFEPKVTVDDGEFVVRLPQLNLVASGTTYDGAINELARVAADYAENFFEHLDYFMQTDRRSQMPWVFRLAVTPRDEWFDLLSPPVPVAVPELA